MLTYPIELVSSLLSFVQDEVCESRRLGLRATLLVECSLQPEATLLGLYFLRLFVFGPLGCVPAFLEVLKGVCTQDGRAIVILHALTHWEHSQLGGECVVAASHVKPIEAFKATSADFSLLDNR